MVALALLAGPAWAAPLSPVVPPTAGVDVAFGLGTGVELLRERGCDGANCDAQRRATVKAGQVGVQVAPPLGLYAHARLLQEDLPAAAYTGDGWGAGVGLRGAVPVGDTWGLWAWAEVDHGRTGATSTSDEGSSAARWQVEAALLAHAGDPRDGAVAWAGVSGIPWTNDHADVVDGEVRLALGPPVPLEAVLGVELLSEPLGGPWSRWRLTAGLQGTAGARTSIAGWLGLEL